MNYFLNLMNRTAKFEELVKLRLETNMFHLLSQKFHELFIKASYLINVVKRFVWTNFITRNCLLISIVSWLCALSFSTRSRNQPRSDFLRSALDHLIISLALGASNSACGITVHKSFYFSLLSFFSLYLFIFLERIQVTHVFKASGRRRGAPALARDPPAEAPPNSPRGPPRNLLLHHDRLAQLSAGGHRFLVKVGGRHPALHRLETAERRPQMGSKTGLMKHNFYFNFFSSFGPP